MDKRRERAGVVRLGRQNGLSRVASLEFYKRSRRTPMNCALCKVDNAEARYYTPGPDGLHAVGVCGRCASSDDVGTSIAVELARRAKEEP